MNKPKIFIACDTNKTKEVINIISKTKTSKLNIGYKFGLEFFYSLINFLRNLLALNLTLFFSGT